MSTSAAAWLAPDVVLPQRDALLDTEMVAARIGRWLTARGPVAIERCQRLRVNYQIGKSLRVLHRVQALGSCWTISARAFRQGRGDRDFADAAEATSPAAGARPLFHDPELNAVFWVYPNDRKIAGLAAVASGGLSLPEGVPQTWHSTRLAAYAPEKSATLACLDERGAVVAYAKVTANDQLEQDRETYRALCQSAEGSPHLRLPRTLAYLPQHRLLLLEAIAGRRMDDPAAGAHAAEDASRLGVALAAFHGLRPAGAPAFTRFAPSRLLEARRLVVRVRPDVEDSVTTLVDELIARRPEDDGPQVCLHGDVHPKNAIVTDTRVALIDVEDLAAGPAAADLGSYLAGLLYLRRGGRLDRGAHETAARAFLRGYGSVRLVPDIAALRWHTAASLLIERIFRAVSRVRPLGLSHLADLLDDARAVLAECPR